MYTRVFKLADSPMETERNIAIVGATGAVGLEMLKVLERRKFPCRGLRLLASERSAGKVLEFRGNSVEVEELNENSFHDIDIALFSAGSDISRKFAPVAAAAGAVVVDNSSAFRLEDSVPLVVPEINADDIAKHQGIIANPNCTTAIVLMALYPLHQAFNVRRVIAASYQAVSGSGNQGITELKQQTQAVIGGEAVTKQVYPHQIAFNVIPEVDQVNENGYTREEMKLQNEGRKIMRHSTFRASVTCVRVPVIRAHSIAVSAEFKKPASVQEARRVLSDSAGLKVVDDISINKYPMPLNCAGRDDCEVGRIRLDCAVENGLSFWVCGDQLLKGAALNAVQIAELVA